MLQSRFSPDASDSRMTLLPAFEKPAQIDSFMDGRCRAVVTTLIIGLPILMEHRFMTSLLSPLSNLRQYRAQLFSDPLAVRIRALPRRTQQALLLSRVDGLPYGMIAERLDISLEELQKDMVRALVQTGSTDPSLPSQAVQWYVHLQSPQTTASERIDFRRWLDASVDHLKGFHETELHWRRLLVSARHVARHTRYRRRHPQREAIAWLTGSLGLALLMLLAF